LSGGTPPLSPGSRCCYSLFERPRPRRPLSFSSSSFLARSAARLNTMVAKMTRIVSGQRRRRQDHRNGAFGAYLRRSSLRRRIEATASEGASAPQRTLSRTKTPARPHSRVLLQPLRHGRPLPLVPRRHQGPLRHHNPYPRQNQVRFSRREDPSWDLYLSCPAASALENFIRRGTGIVTSEQE
jgi:hypothetical protein